MSTTSRVAVIHAAMTFGTGNTELTVHPGGRGSAADLGSPGIA